jgi:antitoxin HicB
MTMKRKPTSKKSDRHSGSTFDSFLDEEGIRTEVEAVARKRVRGWQLAQKQNSRVKRRTKKSKGKK